VSIKHHNIIRNNILCVTYFVTSVTMPDPVAICHHMRHMR